jgi:hypothetical protein
MVRKRVNWLVSMGQIRRDGNQYELTAAGRRFLDDQRSDTDDSPPGDDDGEGRDRDQRSPPQRAASEGVTGQRSTSQAGPPAVAALTDELEQLHERLGRPLHTTDIEAYGDHDAAQYQLIFDSWGDAGEQAGVPVASSTLEEAIIRELRLYRAGQGGSGADIGGLYAAMEDRLALLYPEINSIWPQIRQKLQSLEDRGMVDIADAQGRYEIRCEPLPMDPEDTPPGATTSVAIDGLADEELAARVTSLETSCDVLGRQVRDSSLRSSRGLARALSYELDALEEREDWEELPQGIRRRLQDTRDRASEAMTAMDDQMSSRSDVGHPSPRSDVLSRYLRELAELIGESPRPETVGFCGRLPHRSYREEFGSWTEALRAAGLDPIDELDRARREHQRIEVLQALKKLQSDLGRRPSRAEMDERGAVSSTTVADRLGQWDGALDLISTVVGDDAGGDRSGPGMDQPRGSASRRGTTTDTGTTIAVEDVGDRWLDARVSCLEDIVDVEERKVRDEPLESCRGLVLGLNWELMTLGTEGLPSDIADRLRDVKARHRWAYQAVRSECTFEPEDGSRPAGRDAMIEAVRELAGHFGESPRAETVGFCGRFSMVACMEEFDSWAGLLQAAGLDPIDELERGKRSFKRVAIIQELKRLCDELGRRPVRTDMDERGAVSSTTVFNRLGGWDEAVDLIAPLVDVPLSDPGAASVSAEPEEPTGTAADRPPSDTEPSEPGEDMLDTIEGLLEDI